ncbi:MAG: helix-turn-helix transcriptional regulator [Oscillospiraceae bacterium]|nr:helix-turn-helix transcriptional regulator [Oscillospiraceae bacterium]
MEKKTIGGFIAALRKANGLTQKQLAEKLNVSDKAVSRWERDETLPDLVLIPVLAEIFGVTSDELLRGQRINPDSGLPTPAPEKREQQVRQILKSNRSRYSMRSTVSIGIAFLGLIAAMIGNLAFLRAYIGFFAGLIFYGAAAVCQTIFMIMGLSAVDDEEFDGTQVGNYRRYLWKTGFGVFSFVITLLLFTLPLITAVPDPYWGLNIEDWVMDGGILGLIGIVILTVLNWILTLILGREKMISIDPVKDTKIRLKLKVIGIGLGVTLLILCCQALFNSVADPILFTKGTEFSTETDFIAYIETPMDECGNILAVLDAEKISDNLMYYTFRDDIGEEYGLYVEKQIVGAIKDGSSVFSVSCWKLNRYVAHIECSWDNNDPYPITVYTQDDYGNGTLIIDWINLTFLVLYFITAIFCTIIYLRKRKNA